MGTCNVTGQARTLLLDDPNPHALRVFAGVVDLAEGQTQSWETITRVVFMKDSRYGSINIDSDMLDSMIRNFDAQVYGQEIPVNLAHVQTGGAAGFVRKLQREGGKLRGLIDWTDLGRDAVIRQGYRYFSAEIHEAYEDPENGTKHGPTLLGAALTIRPRVKRLDPIDPARLQLSLDDETDLPACITRKLADQFIQEARHIMKKHLKQLEEHCRALKLSETVIQQFGATFEAAAKPLGEDEKALDALVQQFAAAADQAAKELADKGGEATINLSINGPGISEARLIEMMEAREAERAKAQASAKAKRDGLLKLFADSVEKAEGLDDDIKKDLAEGAEALIGDNMTEAQVQALAERQIDMGNRIAAAKKLSAMGYGAPMGRGNVHIEINEIGDALKLQEEVNTRLQRTAYGANGRLHLAEDTKLSQFTQDVLRMFDAQHANQIHAAVKNLAGGQVGIGDTDLPVGFRRTVIREALSDLRILEIVQTLTDPAAQGTTQIPYETRDTASVYNDGIVYEGSPIHEGGVTQAMDLAYIVPMKLAMQVSNEVMHFSRSSGINWDAWARNVESNARLIRELIAKRITNVIQRAADAYLATDVSGETFDAQLDGSTSVIKTTNFPIVRNHQQKDMTGTNVGSAENAITVVLNGTTLSEWDGTGTQAAGSYWKLANANLGYIQLVDEAGDPVTPADTGTNTLDYSYATNVLKWDVDLGTDTKAVKWNGFLQAFGARKAMLAQDRYVMPDFALTSYTLHNDASDAENFTSSARREDASVSRDGMLEDIKMVPTWATNVPSDLGEERVIIGERGACSYVVAKAFATGEPFEATDPSTGKPIGKKRAYGEEYSAIKVPSPLKGRFTSVLAYSATGR